MSNKPIKQLIVHETQYCTWYIKTDIETKEYLDILDRTMIDKLNELIRCYNKLSEDYIILKYKVDMLDLESRTIVINRGDSSD